MDIACLRGKRRQRGLSLVELLTTLAVSAAVMALLFPSMQKLMAQQRMVAAVNGVLFHLRLARSEAIKRGLRTVLCPSRDGTRCVESHEWQQGFILFVDENRNRTRDAGETLLRGFHPTSREQPIRILSTRGRQQIRYQATGETPGSNLTMTFCDTGGVADPRAIVLSGTGRPRISAAKPDGAPLDC